MRGQRLVAIALVGIASGALALPTLLAHDPITTRVTWTREISRIVQARCVSCHSPGGRAPMSLVSYEDARPWAKAIREEVLTRRMPKWHAARGYGDFSNDPSLSPFEIALIAAWADGGAPRGTDVEKEEGRRQKEERGDRSAREVTLPCGEQPLPRGSLLAVRPQIEEGASIGIAMKFPDGRREIVALVRAFDPDFPTTYQLRVPLDLPRGSRMLTEMPGSPAGSGGGCSVVVRVRAPR